MLGRVALVKVRATAESVDPETGVRRFWRIESRRAHLEETMVGQMGGWPEMVLSLGVASFYQASGVTPDCTRPPWPSTSPGTRRADDACTDGA
jgi:hypothetical protein